MLPPLANLRLSGNKQGHIQGFCIIRLFLRGMNIMTNPVAFDTKATVSRHRRKSIRNWHTMFSDIYTFKINDIIWTHKREYGNGQSGDWKRQYSPKNRQYRWLNRECKPSKRTDPGLDFNVFNFQQLLELLLFEMQVMLFYREVSYFKMQVVHFPLPLLAFWVRITTFLRKIGRKNPQNRGRPRWPAPLLLQIYEIFQPKARNVKMACRFRPNGRR